MFYWLHQFLKILEFFAKFDDLPSSLFTFTNPNFTELCLYSNLLFKHIRRSLTGGQHEKILRHLIVLKCYFIFHNLSLLSFLHLHFRVKYSNSDLEDYIIKYLRGEVWHWITFQKNLLMKSHTGGKGFVDL